MKVCRLRFRKTTIFYGEPPNDTDAPQRVGRLQRWWNHWYDRLKRAESITGTFLLRFESWLKHFEAPDESMLRGLRGRDSVTLVHAADVEPELVLREWRHMLYRRQVSNAGWLVINALLSPISVLLTPLPGPNIIGYWFVYRLICHAFALLGVRNARRKRFQTHLEPSTELDKFEPTEQSVDALANAMGWIDAARLKQFLRKATGKTTKLDDQPGSHAAA